MKPARAFELLTKFSVLVIAPAAVVTLFWLATVLGNGPANCDTSSDCRHGPGHGLVAGLAWCPIALVLAVAALPLIVSRWRGRIRRAPAWGAPEWWRFGVATALLLAAVGLEYATLRFLMSLGP